MIFVSLAVTLTFVSACAVFNGVLLAAFIAH